MRIVGYFSPFQEIVLAHARRYSMWQAQDVYKLAHQAAMGSGHAVISPEFAKLSLEAEIQTLSEGVNEIVFDSISVDGEIIRIHLRPYINSGFSIAELLDAFIQTSQHFKGSIEQFKDYLAQAEGLVRDKKILICSNDLLEFNQAMFEKGYPAVHHSSEFRIAYQPAYRVVARACLHSF